MSVANEIRSDTLKSEYPGEQWIAEAEALAELLEEFLWRLRNCYNS